MNIVMIIFDSLRQDHVGAYGNDWIRTPHLDAFAKESVRFNGCYPESLPTLQMRKALRTGKRGYPFKNHKNYRGNVAMAMPGWSPIDDSEDTLPEILGEHGYVNGFITDVYHMFRPHNNYHRGFHSWYFLRGQESDMHKCGGHLWQEEVTQHYNEVTGKSEGFRAFVEKYKRNSNFRRTEEDAFPAQLFREGTRWLEDNVDAPRFFLMIDSFDPHEPWDPPKHYRRLYDPDSDVTDLLLSPYHPWKNVMTPQELRRLQADYAGEVTLCDRWFGYFMESLKNSGRLDDTIVCVISDHGHNLGYDPGDKGYMSKQGHPATRSVMDLVCMIRHPKGEGAGMDYDGLIYNFDITRTLLSQAGINPQKPMDGQDIWPWALENKPGRDHITIGYGLTITVITDKWWYNSNAWREAELLYAWREDKDLENNMAKEKPEICKEMYELARTDVGGEFPAYFEDYRNRSGANVNAWLNAPFGATKYSSHNPLTDQVIKRLREFDKRS